MRAKKKEAHEDFKAELKQRLVRATYGSKHGVMRKSDKKKALKLARVGISSFPQAAKEIAEADAIQMLPPQGWVKIEPADRVWRGKYKDGSKWPRSIDTYGCNGALKLILRLIWARFLDDSCLDEADCPVQGLFD